MATAIKNWEAQARTNSILAGSLKVLEERVDDCAALLDWRNEFELKFEELIDSVNTIEMRVKTSEKVLERNKKTKEMMDKLIEQEMAAQNPTEVPADAPAPKKKSTLGAVQDYFKGIIVWLECVVQILISAGLFAGIPNIKDSPTRVLGGLAAGLGLGGGLIGFLATARKPSRTGLNAFLVWQPLLMAISAVFLSKCMDELSKMSRFCSLKVNGVAVADAECDEREDFATTRIALTAVLIIISFTNYLSLLALKDDVYWKELSAHIIEHVPQGRGLLSSRAVTGGQIVPSSATQAEPKAPKPAASNSRMSVMPSSSQRSLLLTAPSQSGAN